jgi:glycosyltransferase involved in cell wall biosynthesis
MTSASGLRVLHVISNLGMGGAETWLMELLRFWSRRGSTQVDLLATSGTVGLFDDEAQHLGARIHYVPFRRNNLPRFVRRFRRILREGHYQAVHDHGDYIAGWHFLMGQGALPPVRVAHVHNPWLHIDANYAVNASRRLTTTVGKRLVTQLATDVCGTSAQILGQYGFPVGTGRRPRVSVVHCGFDVARFNAPREPDRESVLREFGWPESTRLVLFAGRMDRALEFEHPQNHKNTWFALNVVRAAVERDPSVRLLMAGADSDVRPELDRRLEGWGLAEKLRLVGIRHDLPRLMRAADALLFPSRQEGLGMVAVEAQAACLPVLASTAVPRECVVIPELYQALRLDTPIEAWAEALLHRMQKTRPSIEHCRRAVEASPFSIANSARRLEEIYNDSHS